MMIVDCDAVRDVLLEQGIGTMELAARSGLSKKTVSSFLNWGGRPARMGTIAKLARGLNVPPRTLVKKKDTE